MIIKNIDLKVFNIMTNKRGNSEPKDYKHLIEDPKKFNEDNVIFDSYL